MALCKHEMEIETCGLCKPRPGSIEEKPELVDSYQLGKIFEAKYPGQCGVCGGRFPVGSTIAHHKDYGYVGPECL